MGSPLLGLPDGPETKAFRAIQWIWQTDPLLSATVKQWAFLEGGGGSLEGHGKDLDFDPPEPVPDELPALRSFLANQGDYEWGSVRSFRGRLNVAVAIWTPGTHQDDLTNLWHALRSAVYPPQGSERHPIVEARLMAIGGLGSVRDVGGPTRGEAQNAARSYLASAGAFVFHLRMPFDPPPEA